MITLSSRARVDSQVRPGAVFIIRKRTEKRRVQLRLKMADIQRRMDAALKELRALGAAPHSTVPEAERTTEQTAAQIRWIEDSGEQFDLAIGEVNRILYDEVHPAWVEWGLERIDGITIDDKEITGANAAELIESDDEMWNELVAAVEEAAGLTKKQAVNLPSPTTSGAVVDGQTPGTTAPAASGTGSTEAASAPAISPTP